MWTSSEHFVKEAHHTLSTLAAVAFYGLVFVRKEMVKILQTQHKIPLRNLARPKSFPSIKKTACSLVQNEKKDKTQNTLSTKYLTLEHQLREIHQLILRELYVIQFFEVRGKPFALSQCLDISS